MPIEIELFRADTRASKGITTQHLDDVIANYDPAKNPAPIVRGHPEDDAPAFGIVAKLRREGSRLFGTLDNVAQQIVEDVKAKRILNRSAAFWSPWHPSNPTPGKMNFKHLGFLGAQAPGIPNMEPLKFSADESRLGDEEAPAPALIFGAMENPDEPTPVVVVEPKPTPTPAPAQTPTPAPAPAPTPTPTPAAKEGSMTEDELKAAQDKLAADQAKLAADQKALADQNFAARNSAHTAFAASLVEAGKLAPGHKDDLVKAMNALPSEVLEFSSNVKEPPASFFMRLLGGAEPLIKFGATFSAKPGGEDGGDAATAAETARREAEARQANAWQGTK